MIPTYVTPYNGGELRIGWASWDGGRYKERSIKWAYPDKSGKVSRGAPEVPIEVLAEMFLVAYNQGEFNTTLTSSIQKPVPVLTPVAEMRKDALLAEREKLSSYMMIMQKLMVDLPWIDWKEAYNAINMRRASIDAALRPYNL